MKKYIVLILVIIALIASLVIYKTNSHNNSSYQNTKFGYQFFLPSGWYVLDEANDKDNVVITNNPTPDNSAGNPFGSDRIVVGLSSTDISNTQEVMTTEKTIRKISTKNGFQGFVRIDNSTNGKGTAVSLPFSSDETLTTNGKGLKPKSVSFILSGEINEGLLMEITNSFKKL